MEKLLYLKQYCEESFHSIAHFKIDFCERIEGIGIGIGDEWYKPKTYREYTIYPDLNYKFIVNEYYLEVRFEEGTTELQELYNVKLIDAPVEIRPAIVMYFLTQ